jgi:hypothetical protein
LYNVVITMQDFEYIERNANQMIIKDGMLILRRHMETEPFFGVTLANVRHYEVSEIVAE